MSRIRAKNTQPEIILRKAISKTGIRGYRLNYRLLGKPDIVFPKRKIAIFIDGCFWHKCPKCFKKPATNKKFWLEKIEGNKRRDKKVNRHYKKMGWKIIRIWEHDLEKKDFKFDPKKIK
jgi:DNA mismatch endonuclease (patch repair protein)